MGHNRTEYNMNCATLGKLISQNGGLPFLCYNCTEPIKVGQKVVSRRGSNGNRKIYHKQCYESNQIDIPEKDEPRRPKKSFCWLHGEYEGNRQCPKCAKKPNLITTKNW